MFNPCEPFSSRYIPAFKIKGVVAFVLQSYPRGRNHLDENSPPAYLLTHHDDLRIAMLHMNAIEDDPDRRLFLVSDEADMLDLQTMARKKSDMIIYMTIKVPDAEKIAKRLLDPKVRAYINYRLDWRIPCGETVQFLVEFIFGEIYAVLKFRDRHHKTKIEEIENIRAYVL